MAVREREIAPAETTGRLLVLLAGLFWSTGGVFLRLTENAGEWQVIFYRSVFLVLFLTLSIGIQRKGDIAAVFADGGRTGALAGAFLSLAFVCFVLSLYHTTVASSLLILAFTPFLSAIGGRLVLAESVRWATWVAMVFGAVGVGIMVGGKLGSDTLIGEMFAFGSAVSFAAFTVTLRHGKNRNMFPAVWYGGAFSALAAALVLSLDGGGFSISSRDLALCAAMGVIHLGCGLIAYTVGSRSVPAAELPLLSMTEVLFGPVWVLIAVGEMPAAATLAGGAVLLAAIAGNAFTGMRRKALPAGIH
jgi:drug/metabolite transporter (DMT)-like permease